LNTIKYGGETELISLTLENQTDALHLVYEDQGVAYNLFEMTDRSVLEEPGAERRVGGLGILLIEGLATTADYARVGDTNRITLTFRVG
ncbi:MAG: ATP-binding protein, partial [Gammaproteobacteria bacterium]